MEIIKKKVLLIYSRDFIKKEMKIDDKEVHLWLLNSNDLIPMKDQYLQTLNDEELQIMNSFRHFKDKEKFILRHGVLKQLLSGYMGQSFSKNFVHNHMNKPYIRNSEISFNISSCDDHILIGFVKGVDIGVDIECIKPFILYKDVMDESLTNNEKLLVNQQPENLELFFRYWNAKEAILKAIGTGLLFPLNQIDCSALTSENVWTYIKAPFMDHGAWVQSLKNNNLSFVVALKR